MQRKRLSWGKSKVLEFYKDEETEEGKNTYSAEKGSGKASQQYSQLQDYSKEPTRTVSCRNRKVRNSSGMMVSATGENSGVGRTPILNVANEYEVALNQAASSASPSSLENSSPGVSSPDEEESKG